MITIDPVVQTRIDLPFGEQPTYEVDIQWQKDGAWFTYTAESQDGSRGLLVELGNIDSAIRVDQSGTSTSVSVTIDDSDGAVKSVIDQNDPHTREGRVYLSFENITQRQLIYTGDVSSPIVWGEGDRSLSFDLVETLKGGNFSVVSDDFITSALTSAAASKPWPVGFGTVRKAKALDLQAGGFGTTCSDVFVPDPWLARKRWLYQNQPVFWGTYDSGSLFVAATNQRLTFDYNGFNTGHPQYDPFAFPRTQFRRTQRPRDINELEAIYSEQRAKSTGSVCVAGWERFTLNKTITVKIGDNLYARGVMREGGTFNVATWQHPEASRANSYNPSAVHSATVPYSAWGGARGHVGLSSSNGGVSGFGFFPAWLNWQGARSTQTISDAGNQIIPGILLWEDLVATPTSQPVEIEQGAKIVEVDSDVEYIYVINLIESEVHKVYSRVQGEGGGDDLIEVPEDWYTTRLTPVGPFNITELVMTRPISSREGNWSDELYVDYTSTVGPSPTDCIEWVVNNFTGYEVDRTSFDFVRSTIGDQFHCVVAEGLDAIEAMRQMAYQCRCALFLQGGVIFIKYLGSEATGVDTFTASDIIANSMQIEHTVTEDLVTDLTATWYPCDYSVDESTLRVRNNTPRYGVFEDEVFFWAFTQREPVERSAAYWVNRQSRTWRFATFKTTLSKIHLTPFDTVEVELPDQGVSLAGCLIESVNVDVSNNEIEFRVWLPSLAGSTSKALVAYPDDVGYIIPFDPGPQYEAPANHPVFRLQGAGDAERRRPSWERLFDPYTPPFAYPSATNLSAALGNGSDASDP